MIALNHTLAGMAVALVLPAAVAPLVAFMSHFVLDTLPHFGNSQIIKPWTKEFKVYLVADGLFSVLAMTAAVFLIDTWPLVVFCGFMAAAPDVMWAVETRLKPYMKQAYAFHRRIQWGERPYNWPIEIIAALLLSWFVFVGR